MGAASLLLAVVVGVWNGEWFPSGRAEHRAAPEIEQAAIRAAGKMLRSGLDRLDPEGKEGVVLCLNEVRDAETADALCREIGRTNLSVTVVTGYRRRDRFDMQQNAIATTLPVAETHWSLWRKEKGVLPPRGYAAASVVVEPAVTAQVYAVHLKANYGATTPEKRAENRAKREMASSQLVRAVTSKRGAGAALAIVAGDFNMDPWRSEFAGERTISVFTDAGFSNLMALMPAERRWTHPNRRFGNSALDHVLVRGFESVAAPVTVPSEELSDHYAFFGIIQSKANTGIGKGKDED